MTRPSFSKILICDTRGDEVAALTHVAEAGEAFLAVLAQLEAGEPVPAAVDPARGY